MMKAASERPGGGRWWWPREHAFSIGALGFRARSVSVTTLYERCREVLERADSRLGPPEGHGLLCGLFLGVGAPPVSDAWLGEVIGREPGADGAARNCRGPMEELARLTEQSLGDGGLSLELLLPADDAPLSERVEALTQWSAGFLFGLGIGAGEELADLRGEPREFLDDLTELARVDADAEHSESGESDFVEVLEYVRVGVMLVAAQLGERR